MRNTVPGISHYIAKLRAYTQVKEYIINHNLPDDKLFVESCCVGLFPQYVMYASKCFVEETADTFQKECENEGVTKVRDALIKSGADITTEKLTRFENLIGQALFAVPPYGIFAQGMIDQIIMSLVLHGEEKDEYVFQRLLNGEIYP